MRGPGGYGAGRRDDDRGFGRRRDDDYPRRGGWDREREEEYPRRGGWDRDREGGRDDEPRRGGFGGGERGERGAGGPGSLRRFAPPPGEDLSRGDFRRGGGRYGDDDRRGMMNGTPPPLPGRTGLAVPSAQETAEAEAARKAAEEEKKAKKAEEAAKRAAEEEAKRKAKEDEARRLKEELEAQKAAAAECAAVAAELVASGAKGKDLVAKTKELGAKAKGSALLGAVLAAQASDEALAGLAWLAGAAYGPALKALLAGDAADQKEAVYAVQRAVEARGYPKVGDDPLLEKLFHGLYGADILDEAAFTGWRDDDREEGNKRKAVVQTTPWFVWLETADEDDDEDGEDDASIEELNNI